MKVRSAALTTCLFAACLGVVLCAPLAQGAAPAWAPIAHSGPTNLPPQQSEVQRLAVDAEAGSFSLGVHKVAAIVTGNLGGSGATAISSPSVKAGSVAVGQGVIGPDIAPGTTIASITKFLGTIISIKLSAPATNSGSVNGATFYAVTASDATGALDFDAEAAEVEAALDALSTVGGEGGEIEVSGGPGAKGGLDPYLLGFEGSFEGQDVPAPGLPVITVEDALLSGGTNTGARLSTALEGGPGTTTIAIYAQNVGGVPSTGAADPVELTFSLPAGVSTTETPTGELGTDTGWSCAPEGADRAEVTCTSERVAGPGLTLPPLNAPVKAGPGASSGDVGIEISGGGAAGAGEYEMPLILSAIPSPPGFQAFTAATYRDDGTVDTDAGAHPYSASTGILVNTVRAPNGVAVPAGELRDIVVDTPPGFIGNPTATPSCPEASEQSECPLESVVATAQVPNGVFGRLGDRSAVNSIQAPFGYPAKFRFLTGGNQIIVNVAASLRSDEDYGLEVGSRDTPQIQPVHGAFFTIWGTPADAGHDGQRCRGAFLGPPCKSNAEILAEGGEEVAFLTNPVDCAEEARRAPVATLNVNTWQNPELLFSEAVALQPVTDCEELEFEAGFEFEPGTDDADSPASFETELSTPAEGLVDPDGRMNPTIKQTVVELPEGVVLNASAADGLEACSEEEIGLRGTGFPRPNEIRFDKAPDECPDAAKIGTGELQSELIAEPLQADLFLAEQGEGNPFGSLFAIYLVIEDPRNGIFIKLPGEVRVDEGDGAQTITFRDLPPLPFSHLRLQLKGGDRSPLATPAICGDYTTEATNTPWSAPESGPPLRSASGFEIDEGPGGGECAGSPEGRPFGLGFSAGTDAPVAGAFSPLRLGVTRPDGAQELGTLQFTPPPGLAASLKGIPYCPEAAIAAAADRDGKDEQDSPSCPPASRLGSALAGAGSGPRPFYAPGELYLAGPYKGAPLSIVAITPAVAGPFDLGNVVVRSAVSVNPVTAQVSAKTDPLPRIVKGVPLRIRDVRVILDRPGFALNPSGCEEKAIGLRARGASGARTDLTSRFQVGNCEALGFKPQMSLRLFGGVKRGAYQGLRAVVRPRPGDANISRTAVRMPRSAFLAQEHIRTVCTRVQFAAGACPKGAIYGRAIAWSPLLDHPLQGNVYLRSSDNELPDVVADLRGPAHQPIRVEVVGRTDSVNGALRNTFDVVPDAPVSYFRLQIFGGKKGLIVNSRNICRGQNRAAVGLNAHNGRRARLRPLLRNKRCAKLRKANKRKAAKRSAHRSKRRGA